MGAHSPTWTEWYITVLLLSCSHITPWCGMIGQGRIAAVSPEGFAKSTTAGMIRCTLILLSISVKQAFTYLCRKYKWFSKVFVFSCQNGYTQLLWPYTRACGSGKQLLNLLIHVTVSNNMSRGNSDNNENVYWIMFSCVYIFVKENTTVLGGRGVLFCHSCLFVGFLPHRFFF